VFDKPGDKFAHMMDWYGGLEEKDKKEKARPIFLFQKNVPFVIAAVINMVVFPSTILTFLIYLQFNIKSQTLSV